MTGLLKAQHHVIYIPGLGDKNVGMQRLAVWAWRSYGIYGHCHPVHWADDEPFDDKLKSVVKHVDELVSQGHIVSLMGSSAGASMALHVFAARKNRIASVVLICGELGDVKEIEGPYLVENPAFRVSMEHLPETLKKLSPEVRRRVMSVRPWYDETVRLKDMYLDGARMFSTVSFGHAVTIGFTLTLDFFIPYYFMTKWARKI